MKVSLTYNSPGGRDSEQGVETILPHDVNIQNHSITQLLYFGRFPLLQKQILFLVVRCEFK